MTSGLFFFIFHGLNNSLAEPPKNENETATPVKTPVLLKQSILHYPREAGTLVGEVLVIVDVNETGNVTRARVTQGPEVFHTEAIAGCIRVHEDDP